MVFSGVFDVFQSTQRHFRIHEVRIAFYESAPLKIARHCDRTIAQLFDGAVNFIRIALEDACQGIVSFLHLANYNGFELAAGVLEIEVGLNVLA
jgi:hypothetical protein